MKKKSNKHLIIPREKSDMKGKEYPYSIDTRYDYSARYIVEVINNIGHAMGDVMHTVGGHMSSAYYCVKSKFSHGVPLGSEKCQEFFASPQATKKRPSTCDFEPTEEIQPLLSTALGKK